MNHLHSSELQGQLATQSLSRTGTSRSFPEAGKDGLTLGCSTCSKMEDALIVLQEYSCLLFCILPWKQHLVKYAPREINLFPEFRTKDPQGLG